MRLTPHFTLEELIVTQVRSVDNTPSNAIIETLKATAEKMEAVRALLGRPIIVTSGYRCEAVNSRVGGSKTSHHMTGHAVDFICPGYGTPLEICRAIVASNIDLDQLIEEGQWVHLSFAPTNRREILTKAPGGGFYAGLPKDRTTA